MECVFPMKDTGLLGMLSIYGLLNVEEEKEKLCDFTTLFNIKMKLNKKWDRKCGIIVSEEAKAE